MSLELFDLSGRLALVTGSGAGIGAALARGLARAGARVVINGRNPDTVARTVDALAAEGLDASAQPFDVTDRDAVHDGIAAIEHRAGPLEIVVNNAGIQRRVPLHEASAATWREVMDTNLDGVFHVGAEAARHMIPRGRGKIINVCSLMSEVGRPTTGPYTAAKGAVKMLTRAMCVDWAPHNIQVNGIGPGYFDTALNRALVDDPEFDAWLRRRTPAGRWGEVGELVGAAVFLASDASSFVNGQIIYVDGGVLSSL